MDETAKSRDTLQQAVEVDKRCHGQRRECDRVVRGEAKLEVCLGVDQELPSVSPAVTTLGASGSHQGATRKS